MGGLGVRGSPGVGGFAPGLPKGCGLNYKGVWGGEGGVFQVIFQAKFKVFQGINPLPGLWPSLIFPFRLIVT